MIKLESIAEMITYKLILFAEMKIRPTAVKIIRTKISRMLGSIKWFLTLRPRRPKMFMSIWWFLRKGFAL